MGALGDVLDSFTLPSVDGVEARWVETNVLWCHEPTLDPGETAGGASRSRGVSFDT